MLSLGAETLANVIESFNSTSSYSKIPLFRPPLVLSKSELICGAVLILNVEHNYR